MVDAASRPTYVLTVDAVKWAIAALRRPKIHPQLLAYLQVHRHSREDERLDPQMNELRALLEVPGGPPNKPYYRPFWNQDSDPSRYWLNENLAGSFAPSSIRNAFFVKGGHYVFPPEHATLALSTLMYGEPVPVLPLGVYLFRNFGFRISGQESPEDLVLSPIDPENARRSDPSEYEHGGGVGPVLVARDPDPSLVDNGRHRSQRGSESSDWRPEPRDVVTAFRQRFRFTNAQEFGQLFDDSEPSVAFEWFELVVQQEVE